jgi:hypothetical protein
MLKRTKRHIITFALGVGITATTVALYTPSSADSTTKLAPQLVDKDAIIEALTETHELVGLTGDISKTVRLQDNRWYGDKTYELTLEGTFKIGVATADVSITTQGNTVIVRLPQPRIIAVELPFDKAAISKDVGLLRQDLSESEMQALYKEAREQAVADVKVNIKAREEAEDAVENALAELIGRLPAVEGVMFVD